MSLRDRIPHLPTEKNGEPVFGAPWHAQAFAMTLALHERGVFTWPEWAEALGKELSGDRHGSDEDGYYLAWLAALETMVREKNLARDEEVSQRYAAWSKAALDTPHGMPIKLPSKR